MCHPLAPLLVPAYPPVSLNAGILKYLTPKYKYIPVYISLWLHGRWTPVSVRVCPHPYLLGKHNGGTLLLYK